MAEVKANKGLLRSTKLHVEDSGGTGRPVVLIHGWPLSGESWRAQLSTLRDAGHRVITYDRRGFGRSDKPPKGYDYDTLADDLHGVLTELDLHEVTLVGFSMGGGEVARYVARHGEERLHSVVFAAAVTPALMQGEDNPDGPLPLVEAQNMESGLIDDRDLFFDEFMTKFFSVGDTLQVTEEQLQEAIALCHQSSQTAAVECMEAFGTTDFRGDVEEVTVPTLVLHGDSDDIVPFEGSGKRTHEAVASSELALIEGAPHGCNVSHAGEFNSALVDFLAKA